jgi:hypothetical protein
MNALPPPPTMSSLLAMFRKEVKSDRRDAEVTLVSRWIRCGYNLTVLSTKVKGITEETIEAGRQHATRILSY